MIHPQAIVDPGATVADNVCTVGPWTFIGPDVEIGPDCVIESHVVIKGPTRIGAGNHIYQFSSVGRGHSGSQIPERAHAAAHWRP
jgi:UDP-N-acetylglucosamine acyltransferase